MESASVVCGCLQLEVDFSPVYDRQPHPDSTLESAIEKVFSCCMHVDHWHVWWMAGFAFCMQVDYLHGLLLVLNGNVC